MHSVDKTRRILGTRIKGLRKTKKLTLEKMAERANINFVYLSNIEHGKENPTLLLLIRIAKALNVNLHELFEDRPENARTQKERLKTLTSEIRDKDKIKIALKLIKSTLR